MENKPEITLSFEIYNGGLKPLFPRIAIALDKTDVIYSCVVKSSLKNNENIEHIKGVMSSLLKIDEFELEMDQCLRAWEIYGILHLLKKPDVEDAWITAGKIIGI